VILRCLFVLLLALFAQGVGAQVSISSVSSATVSHGQSITITGSGFGTKSPAKPYAYANFDDLTAAPVAALSQVSSFTIVEALSPVAGVGIRGTGALRSTFSDCASNGCGAGCTYYCDTGGVSQNFNTLVGFYGLPVNIYGNKWYVFRKGRRNFTVTDAFNWKVLRFWYSDGSLYWQTGNGNLAEEALPNAGYGCAWQSPLSSVCTDSITTAQTRGVGDGVTWNTEQFIGTPGTSSGVGGFFHAIMNGRTSISVPYFDYATKIFNMDQGASREIYIVHDESANEPDPPSGSLTYWDDVYFDTAWSRVMLSNRSTWGTASSGPLYEIQIPTAWSDTSVTAQVNIGEFTNGQTAYLYVINSNNVANTNGYPLTIGSGGGGTPPTVSSLTCTPTTVQSIGTTVCTAVASQSPTSYAWAVTDCTAAQCSATTPTATSSTTYTCLYGGSCRPCVTAINGSGSSAQFCAATNYLTVRYRQPLGFGAN